MPAASHHGKPPVALHPLGEAVFRPFFVTLHHHEASPLHNRADACGGRYFGCHGMLARQPRHRHPRPRRQPPLLAPRLLPRPHHVNRHLRPLLPRRRARWALSYTIARDKNFVDETDDSLIAAAARYFAQKNDTRRAMLSHYYLSLVQFNARNYASSAVAGLRALKYGEELRDSFWLGRICDLMSRINHNTYNMPETERWINRAVEMFKASRDTTFYFESKINQAICYTNLDDDTRAIAILDSIKPLLPNVSNYMQGLWTEAHITPYYHLGMQDEAWKMVMEMNHYPSVIEDDSYFFAKKAQIAVRLNQQDSVDNYISKAVSLSTDSMGDINILSSQLSYFESANDYKSQVKILRQFLESQNRHVSEAIKQSVAVAQRDFYEREVNIHAIKLESTRRIIILLGIILTISIVSGVIFYKQRIKVKNTELEKRMIEINSLKQNLYDNNGCFNELYTDIKQRDKEISRLSLALDGKNSESQKLRTLIDNLFDSHFKALNRLSDEYYESLDGSNPKIFYRNIEHEINTLRQSDFIKSLEKIVNDCRDNAIDRLRSVPSLKNDEITFLTLVIAGLSPRAICLILDLKLKTIYTKRSRLKEKIEKSNSEYRDFILQLLS